LEGLINQATEYKAVERKSKAGDQVTIDFKGMLNGEVFEGSSNYLYLFHQISLQTHHLILVIEEPLLPSSQLQTPHLS
jgi:hypothetical protein